MHTKRYVPPFGDEGGEFQTRNIQQKYIHRALNVLIHLFASDEEFANVGLGDFWRDVTKAEFFKETQPTAVDAYGTDQEIVGFYRAVFGLDLGAVLLPGEFRNSLWDEFCPTGAGQREEIIIKASLGGTGLV